MAHSQEKLILACIDSSSLSDSVIDCSIWLAQVSGQPLCFLHMVEHSHRDENAHHEGNLTPNIREQLLDELSEEEHIKNKQQISEGKKLLKLASQRAEEKGVKEIIINQRHGFLPDELKESDKKISLVILGSRGEVHADSPGLGSQLEESIKATNAPVMIVQEQFVPPKKLLLAYNGNDASKKALAMVAGHPVCEQLDEVHVVSVDKPIEQAQQLVEEARRSLAQFGERLIIEAFEGDPMIKLIHYRREHGIDLTVMGAFSHGTVHGFFFGSFTTSMLLVGESNFLLIQ